MAGNGGTVQVSVYPKVRTGCHAGRTKKPRKGATLFRTFWGRLSYSNVVATAAVFLALGGTSYAAVSLPANSVGTKQIKNHAVTLKKIASSAQRALHGATGPPGPQGAHGPKGDTGATGT